MKKHFGTWSTLATPQNDLLRLQIGKSPYFRSGDQIGQLYVANRTLFSQIKRLLHCERIIRPASVDILTRRGYKSDKIEWMCCMATMSCMDERSCIKNVLTNSYHRWLDVKNL